MRRERYRPHNGETSFALLPETGRKQMESPSTETLMAGFISFLSSPLGPLTKTKELLTLNSTSLGSKIGFLPILLIVEEESRIMNQELRF